MNHLALSCLVLLWRMLLGISIAVDAQRHTSNHAVIVSSSRFWFNYRHTVNALSLYHILKKLGGYHDDNIVLMLADEFASDARNPLKNRIYASTMAREKDISLYNGTEIEIDYRGNDVTVQNLVNVLLGRKLLDGDKKSTPVLHSDENSHVLIYLTGHGGDLFFKFHDVEEIMATEIASVLDQMHAQGRYKEVLLIADTCQAFTLADKITAPNVLAIGSSLRGESSYAHSSDSELGLSVIERYTHAFFQFVAKHGIYGKHTLQTAMIDPYPFNVQRAHITGKDDTSQRKLSEIPIADYFANVQRKQKAATRLLQQKQPVFSMPQIVMKDNGECAVQTPESSLSSQRRLDEAAWLSGGGMDPTDPVFLAWTVGLVMIVVAGSWQL